MSAPEGASLTGWSSDRLASLATIVVRYVTRAGPNFPQSSGAIRVPKDYCFCARELLVTRCKRSAEHYWDRGRAEEIMFHSD